MKLLFIMALVLCSFQTKHKNGAATITPSCTSCSSTLVSFTGTGYRPGREISVQYYGNVGHSGTVFNVAIVDANGNISFDIDFPNPSETYTVKVYQRKSTRDQYDFMAEVDVEIL